MFKSVSRNTIGQNIEVNVEISKALATFSRLARLPRSRLPKEDFCHCGQAMTGYIFGRFFLTKFVLPNQSKNDCKSMFLAFDRISL